MRRHHTVRTSDQLKHILYINPSAVHGGAEEVLVLYMRSAQENGYQPVLVVPEKGWLTEQCEAINIPYELLPTLPNPFTSLHWRQQLKPLLPNALAIMRLVRQWDAVLVHSNTPRASYHGGLGARLAGVKAISHVHDITRLPYASPIKARFLSLLADRILVVSHAVEKAIINLAPRLQSRIQTLYNGWDISRYANVKAAKLNQMFGIPSDAIIIGNVSAMTPWKGQDVLIEAFRSLHANHPTTRLLLVGGAQGNEEQIRYERQLHQQVADYGLDDVVIFTGWREDVWSLMKSFDLFVHVPTQPDPLPTVLLHACALSCPIIASEIGGIPEIIIDGYCGLLVPARNATSLSRTLSELLREPRRQQRLREQARAHFIKTFSQDNMTAGLALVYQECLS